MFHQPIFPKHEFQHRFERAWQQMAAAGLDALIAYSPGNQFWLTGFLGSLSAKRFPEFSHHVLFPKVILPQGRAPIIVGLQTPAETYARETYVTDIRTVLPPVEENRPKAIKEVLTGLSLQRQRVGIDLGAFGSISVPEFETLKKALPHIAFIDTAELFSRLRMVKTPAEVSYLRTAVEIQNNAFRKFVRRIGRGMSETELMFTMFQCQAEAGATEVGIAMPWTHPGYTFFRAQYPDRLMEPGDFQWFDAGAIYRGYNSDYDIILVWGEPSPEYLKTFETMKAIYTAALEFWKPGRPITEIAQDVLKVVRQHGAVDPLEGQFIGHNLGYEMVEKPWLGIGCPPDLRLEVNMVVAPEWSIVTPYGPILFEENFVVGETGLERLTDFPSKLQVIHS
jgi:Xaa-Pro aminopeptidase